MKNIIIRVDDETHEEMKRLAKKKRLSMNYLITEMILAAIRKDFK